MKKIIILLIGIILIGGVFYLKGVERKDIISNQKISCQWEILNEIKSLLREIRESLKPFQRDRWV